MTNWTPENIIAIIVAIGTVITAIGAAVHSINTRTRLNDHFENEHVEQDAEKKVE